MNIEIILLRLKEHYSIYIPFFQLRSILNDSMGAGRLHEGWENTNLMSLPADLIPHVSRWAKLIGRINPAVTPSVLLFILIIAMNIFIFYSFFNGINVSSRTGTITHI